MAQSIREVDRFGVKRRILQQQSIGKRRAGDLRVLNPLYDNYF